MKISFGTHFCAGALVVYVLLSSLYSFIGGLTIAEGFAYAPNVWAAIAFGLVWGTIRYLDEKSRKK